MIITTINNLFHDRNGEKRQAIIDGFPLALRENAKIISRLMKFNNYPIFTPIEVTIDSDVVKIPDRINCKKIPTWRTWFLNEEQKLILTCIYSRHCNGYIREEMLRKLNGNTRNFTIPYVVQLLSEYVIELFPIIDAQINQNNIEEYNKYYKANQLYFRKVEKRIMSYWNEYYGYYKTYKKSEYTGFQILNRIKFYGTNKL